MLVFQGSQNTTIKQHRQHMTYWHSNITLQELNTFKAQLLDRKQELESQSNASTLSRNPVDLDQSRVGRLSRMDALQVQAMQKALEGKRAEEIIRIQWALKRIEDECYGECTRCGEEIPRVRLELDPSLPTCVHCADL